MKKATLIVLSVLLIILAINELDQRLCWGINHPRHIQIALNEIHQRTVENVAIYSQNPRIIEYCKSLDKSPTEEDTYGYCCAFLVWCLDKAGVGDAFPHFAYRYAWSYLIEGTPPREGDIVFLKKDDFGHIAFIYKMHDDGTFDMLGGNQGGEVNILPNVKQSYVTGYARVDYNHIEDIKRWHGKWMKKIKYFLFNK